MRKVDAALCLAPEPPGAGSEIAGVLLPEPLRLLSLKDLLEEEVALDWDVEGLILQGERVLICGEPGAMKSWLLLDLGLALSTGKP